MCNLGSTTDLTNLFAELHDGDGAAAERILNLVYDELRRLAAQKLSREQPGMTLQPTALVHEAWMRIGGQDQATFRDRSYFFAACGEAMRRILVESARSKQSLKRGGDRAQVELSSGIAAAAPDGMEALDILALDEALTKLGAESPRKARLVELRFFAGMEIEEAALALDISRATADRDWAFAKAYLSVELQDGTGS